MAGSLRSLEEQIKQAKASITTGSSSGSRESRMKTVPKLFEQIEEPGERFESIDERVRFEEPKNYSEIARQAGTRFADLGNIAGEFAQTPGKTNEIVRTGRKSPDAPTSDEKSFWRGGLNSASGEVDHIIPLWLGGTNNPANLRVIPKKQHRDIVTRVQKAVEHLYRNPELSKKYFGRELSLPEARNFAINANLVHKSALKGYKFNKTYGDVLADNPEQVVEFSADILSNFQQDPKDIGFFDVINPFSDWRGTNKRLREAGEKVGRGVAEKAPDTGFGEFSKGFVSGLTLGHITYEEEENFDPTAKQQLAGMIGSVGGGLLGMLTIGAAMKAGTAVSAPAGVASPNFLAPSSAASATSGAAGTTGVAGGAARFLAAVKRINPTIAKKVEKFVAPASDVIDVKSKRGIISRTIGKIRKKDGPMKKAQDLADSLTPSFAQGFRKRFLEDVAIFGTIGQLTRQEDQELSTRAKRLSEDLAYGGLTAAVPGGLSAKLAAVWMGAGLIDVVSGASQSEAAVNATVMTLFHGIGGFRNSGLTKETIAKYSDDTALKSRNKWLKKEASESKIPEKIDFEAPDAEAKKLALQEYLDKETEVIKKAINDSEISWAEKRKEKQSAVFTARHLYRKAFPDDQAELMAQDDMRELVRRFDIDDDKYAQDFKDAGARKKALDDMAPIDANSPTAVAFKTKGANGGQPTSLTTNTAEMLSEGGFTAEGQMIYPKSTTKVFLVKSPEAEARSQRKHNPDPASDSDLHTQDIFEVQAVGENGSIHSFGFADESSSPAIFNRLRESGVDQSEAKIDWFHFDGDNVSISVSLSEDNLSRATEFDAMTKGQGKGKRKKKRRTEEKVEEPEVIAEEPEVSTAVAVKGEDSLAKVHEGEVVSEVTPPAKAEPRVVKVPSLASAQIRKPKKEQGKYVQLIGDAKTPKSEQYRAQKRAKFSKADIENAKGRFSEGEAPKDVEVALNDEELLQAVLDTAIALQSESLKKTGLKSTEREIKLYKQVRDLTDEVVNHRKYPEGELDQIRKSLIKARLLDPETIDPRVKTLAEQKVEEQGMSYADAHEEATEDVLMHAMGGKPLPMPKEPKTQETLAEAAKRVRKASERAEETVLVKEWDHVQTGAEGATDTVPVGAQSIGELVEPAGRVKRRESAVKVRHLRGDDDPNVIKKATGRNPAGSEKVNQAGRTREQQKEFDKRDAELVDLIGDKGTEPPKDEGSSGYRSRKLKEVQTHIYGEKGDLGTRKKRRTADNEMSVGKPSKAEAGAGIVLKAEDLKELEQRANIHVYENARALKKRELDVIGDAKGVTESSVDIFNPLYKVASYDGAENFHMMSLRLDKAVADETIDGLSDEYYTVLRALMDEDMSLIEKHNVLRYRPEFGGQASKANGMFSDILDETPATPEMRDNFIQAYVDLERIDLGRIPDDIITLPPIRDRIFEMDATAKDAFEELQVESKGREGEDVAALSEDEALLKALKGAQNKERTDLDVLAEADEAFKKEVAAGKTLDTKANNTRFLEGYAIGKREGMNADIANLPSMKKRLENPESIAMIPEREGQIQRLGKSEGLYKGKDAIAGEKRGLDQNTIKDIESGKIDSTYVNEHGKKIKIKNNVVLAIRSSASRSTGTLKQFWESLEIKLADLAKGETKGGDVPAGLDYREWDVPNANAVFDSFNQMARMSETQRNAFQWEGNSNLLTTDFLAKEEFLGADGARKMAKLQQMIIQRADEIKDSTGKDAYTSSWVALEEAPRPTEISATNLGRSIDRMETDLGRELIAEARGDATKIRAIEDYLGTNNDEFLLDHPELNKIAGKHLESKATRVNLEHADAKRKGEIQETHMETSQERKVRNEAEGQPGDDTNLGYIDEEPLEEISRGDLTFGALADPGIKAHYESLSEKAKEEALDKNVTAIAKSILAGTKVAVEKDQFVKGKALDRLIKKYREMTEFEAEAKVLSDPKTGDTKELREVQARIAKLKGEPYKQLAGEGKAFKTARDEQVEASKFGSTDVHVTKAERTKLENSLKEQEAKAVKLTEELDEARQQGDLSENAAYTTAKDELTKVRASITGTKDDLNRVVILEDVKSTGEYANVGSGVKVKVLVGKDAEGKEIWEEKFLYIVSSKTKKSAIVGGADKISAESELGSDLLGTKAGDTISDAKGRPYEVIEVSGGGGPKAVQEASRPEARPANQSDLVPASEALQKLRSRDRDVVGSAPPPKATGKASTKLKAKTGSALKVSTSRDTVIKDAKRNLDSLLEQKKAAVNPKQSEDAIKIVRRKLVALLDKQKKSDDPKSFDEEIGVVKRRLASLLKKQKEAQDPKRFDQEIERLQKVIG